MAVSSFSLGCIPATLPNKLTVMPLLGIFAASSSISSPSYHINDSSIQIPSAQENCFERRPLLMGIGALALSILPSSSLLAQEVLENYSAFVDKIDGYSYYYPSDWREFDFRAHDSAFKDRYLQLQNVRVSFIPTEKTDIHDLGPMEEVISNLARNIYAAPNQRATIYSMQERTIDGKNYYTFEYQLTSPNFARTAFATIAIANRRYYTLIVGANERRWKRVRNKLKVVADSFRVLDL
ncbi:hypothetical protein Nepgr_001192 [Nepenthes gracilis]|uniref:PsbP C-terminal domain-containing protein n=1 Tax=Nepenthes gracilis TaxID=150966 RepID=A0AAD3P4R9_NEPGR|nr:hypothetical protein Nepgr_001192 [Nepenthes gracilis]